MTTSSRYAVAHALLEARSLSALQDMLVEIKRARRRSYLFEFNGRTLVVTRTEAKSLVLQYIDKKTPPLPRATGGTP